ncbi:MAG: LrgB family protein [Clostridiales bacterium]|nr:LrgB family protein [Clostridiales bacterium]
MIDTLTATPFFGLGLSLLCWILAVKFQEKTGLLVCNPVLVSSLLVILVLVVFRIPLENYNLGGDIIKMLLSPATAVLALNIYQQRKVLKEHFWPVVLGCLVGSLASILGVQLMCRMFQTESSLLNSLLPKSVTTAIAVSISESNGGLPGLTAAAVCVTGIEGAMLAPFFAKIFHVTDPVAEGVAIGACSHAVGTSKALEIGPLQGAMSSIALCICGIITSLIAGFFAV